MAWTDAQWRFNRLCVREKACEFDHAFIGRAVAYSV